jgi:hypothetical protein
VLLNRVIERVRRHDLRGLRERFEREQFRRPLIIVPSILGTRIVDGDQVLWGTVPRLYFGPAIAAAGRARASGLLDGFTVVPGLYTYDVYGGLLRFLERIGGYRRERDLFVLEYDWRESVASGAEQLATLVERVHGITDGPVDIVAISSGGIVVRHFLAVRASRIGRVIYVGTPQRGSFQSLSMLHAGVQMVPLGKRFGPDELAACKTCWDALPHPDDTVFVDGRGAAVPESLYDPAVWRRLRLGPNTAGLEAHLERAQRLHRVLDNAPAHADSVVIGARHLPTLSKIVVRAGRAELPDCSPRPRDPLAPHLFEPGDTALPARSLEGLAGLARSRIHYVTPSIHHRLPAEPDVHRIVLETLLDGQLPGSLEPRNR